MPKCLPRKAIPTPFGKIYTPKLCTPPFEIPKLPDAREKRIILQGIGEDLTQIIALIPVVGDIAADTISDIHHAEIHRELSKDEYDKFANYNKFLPTSLALARLFLFKEV